MQNSFKLSFLPFAVVLLLGSAAVTGGGIYLGSSSNVLEDADATMVAVAVEFCPDGWEEPSEEPEAGPCPPNDSTEGEGAGDSGEGNSPPSDDGPGTAVTPGGSSDPLAGLGAGGAPSAGGGCGSGDGEESSGEGQKSESEDTVAGGGATGGGGQSDPCPSPDGSSDGGGCAGAKGPSSFVISFMAQESSLGGGSSSGGMAAIGVPPESSMVPPSGFRSAPSSGNVRGISAPIDAQSVNALDGSLVQIRTDLELPGGANGFSLGRIYRSSLARYDGFIGAGWEINSLRRIKVSLANGNNDPEEFWALEGSGRESGTFRRIPGTTDWFSNSVRDDQYQYFAATAADPDKLIHYLIDGGQETFELLPLGTWYQMTRKEDIYGNGYDLDYVTGVIGSPTYWTLDKVVDDLGREFRFHYHPTHGRIEKVEAWAGANLLAKVDYSYDTKADGTIVLSKVEKGMIPTDDGTGAIIQVRETESYLYEDKDTAQQPYDYWRLSGVVNGMSEAVVSWEYHADINNMGKVWKQLDRPGGVKRAEGVHTYLYPSVFKTEYESPDGAVREFHLDGDGRLISRVEFPVGLPILTTLFDYDSTSCAVCSHPERITYPDGSYSFFQYDDFGNLLVRWKYPIPSSNLPPRVERWSWSGFDPRFGQMRMRLLEHELQRDANPVEDPDHPCNHPSCNGLVGAAGHHVDIFIWSADERSLDQIDFGLMQKSADASPTFLNRQANFSYFLDGRIKSIHEFVDGAEVAREEFALNSVNGAYLKSKTYTDIQQSESWTETYSVSPNTYFLETVTGVDGAVTRYSRLGVGRVYRVEEDANGANAARTTEIRYDAAGRLNQVSFLASDGSSGDFLLHLDESGTPYEVDSTIQGGPQRKMRMEHSLGGMRLSTEDWRGWKTETEYGFGSLMLPIKVTQRDRNSNSRVIWQVGDGGSDLGYDNRGRVTSYRNVDGWKTYQQYNARGGLKYRFRQIDATHYATNAFFYDARGFVREKEVGVLEGNPLAFTLGDLTWLQHIVYSKNIHGFLMSRAVYESGNTNEARFVRYELDGRGRAVKIKEYQGDRSGSSSPTLVVTEVDYDAMNRPLQVRFMESALSSIPTSLTDYWYEDAQRKVTTIETFGIGGPREKFESTYDALGRIENSTQYAWDGGTWTTPRTWNYEFDGLDTFLALTEPLGKRTAWEKSDLGQLLFERVSDGATTQTTSYTYDPLSGALQSVTDAVGSTTFYSTFSEWDRPKKVTYPDGRTFETKAYDLLGRRTQTLDSRGVEHNYSYDYSYLISDSVVKPASPVVPGPDAISWKYDRTRAAPTSSKVWKNGTAIWKTSFAVNDLGELTAETQGEGAYAKTWGWTHGFAGELLTVDYPVGLGISNGAFGYDLSGRVQRMQYWNGSTLLSDDSASFEGFRSTGRTDAVSGIAAAFRYDEFGRVDRVEWSKEVGGSPNILDGQERAFDLANRVTSRQRVIDSLGDVFVHDGFGRMQHWYQNVPGAVSNAANTTPATWSGAEHYTLNAVYSRSKVVKEDSLGASTTFNYDENAAHFYTNAGGQNQTIQDGRLNSDGTHYYRWDAWGQLAEVENISSGVVLRKHYYDAEGRRVRTDERDQGVTTTKRQVYWGARLAATFVEGTPISDLRTYGYAGGADGESFAEVSSSGSANGSYALARDFQGSILALIDRTTGVVVERYRYGAFGDVQIEDAQGVVLAESAYGNERFFLGKIFDAEVGIYDLRARWYDPESGSFLAPDPMGSADSWNMYQYGFGSPGTWMDPFGLNQEPSWWTTKVTGTDGEPHDVAVGGAGGGEVRDFTNVSGDTFLFAAGSLVVDPLLIIGARASRAPVSLAGLIARNIGALGAILVCGTVYVYWDGLLAFMEAARAVDAGKNGRHGDAGRAKEKARKLIGELEKQLDDDPDMSRKDKIKIKNKIERIWKEAQNKDKGGTHGRNKKT